MRLDHIAYRVAQGKRDEAAKFFMDAFGYKQQGNPFEIYFDENHKEKAMCVALEPPERITAYNGTHLNFPMVWYDWRWCGNRDYKVSWHFPPEIFISEGSEGSIVEEWVRNRGGVGGIHHLAYQVEDVTAKVKEFKDNGWLEFTSEPVVCSNGLTQVFSKPNCIGVVIEFIQRGSSNQGFCADSVKSLMLASKGD